MTATAPAEEGHFPTTDDSAQSTASKLAALWFRVHGLLDRLLAVAKHLAALTARMENRAAGPSPDYPPNQVPWGVYYGDREPREPSWQTSLLKILVMVMCPLIVVGLPALIGILFTMSNRLTRIEAHTDGNQQMVIQRLDAQDKHLEATDRQVEEIKREIWPHKR